ncbi:MAG: M99 family carboxypeptidase catalytic domain-containing protein [Desulfobacca sp.]|uniref:M99 family carboxypeptidase catalytic domain-containing protein n=1 Tax=Desulfobacca sp. TaxID=2067990 RepID=UPI00404B0057
MPRKVAAAVFFLCLLWLSLGPVTAVAAESAALRQRGLIGRHQFYQTPYYIFASGRPGPRVLVQAGIHGDEPAGIFALEQLLPRLRVHSGFLIILPRMNPPAIAIQRRFFNLDLNRVFPGGPQPAPYEFALAREIYHLVKDNQIEYTLTLHEARTLHNLRRAKSFGQTIVYGVEPPPRLIWPWLQALNKELPLAEKFCHYYCPQEYGATDVMVRELRLRGGFAVETWRGLDLQRRIALQQLAVLTFLQQVGLEFSLK